MICSLTLQDIQKIFMNNTKKPYRLFAPLCVGILFVSTVFLAGCQTILTPLPPSIDHNINAPIQFDISGKIGIASTSTGKTQSGSAFYSWKQAGERFAIGLVGALGIGTTTISFDGRTATVDNELTGPITADTPEQLLQQATGWQAPISQLPHWIVGQNAPSDSSQDTDGQNRLIKAINGDWTAYFEYKDQDKTPSRLRITHTDGHRIIMTITHHK